MALLSGITSCNRYDIFTWPQLTPVTIFWNVDLYKYLTFLMFCKIALLQATDEFLILGVVVELRGFGFFCVVVGLQYNLKFIVVSYFLFEMFRFMANFFLLAVICGFSLCHLCF